MFIYYPVSTIIRHLTRHLNGETNQFLIGRERRKRQIGFSAYGKEGDPPLKPLLLLQTEL